MAVDEPPSGKPAPAGARAADAPPTSRLGRLARLGALAPKALPLASVAVKRALGAGAAKNAAPPPVTAAELEAAKKAAEAMLKTLGDMKGLPLKLGQMASYIDGLAPPGYEERFHAVLAKLQSKAPPLSPEAARRVVTEELGEAPEKVFASWEHEPFAAASIGQVHRAVTHGGDAVAVKVQYPGIDRAIENDLKSLSMMETLIAPLGRRYGTKETVAEIHAVFRAELDYRHEADMTERFRRIHEGDADIVIPRVHHGLTTRRVITTDLIGGEDYATFVGRANQAERTAAGVTIWRFMFRAFLQHGTLYADPHPGNYRFLGGGRVAFLDFGCTKVLAPELIAGIKRYVRAAQREDWPEFERACVEVLGYDRSDVAGWALYTDYTKLLLRPFTTRGPFRFTREYAREAVAFLARGTRSLVLVDGKPQLPKPIDMPADFTFVGRLQWGLGSVLAGLEVEADFRAISEPYF